MEVKEYRKSFHGINQKIDSGEDLGKNGINGSVRSQNMYDYSHLRGQTTGLRDPGMQPS